MSNFLENYGKSIFVLVLIAILIAFASPLGIKIKEYTLARVNETDKIGNDDINKTNGQITRPEEPTEAVDEIYCIYYDDGEMTISQNEIEPKEGKTVVKKGFFDSPIYCTQIMTTVEFVGAVKPKSCYQWFKFCENLTEIKNMENLYLPSNISGIFSFCKNLTSINLSNLNTSNVTNMKDMFGACYSLTSLDLSNFDTRKVTDMSNMFSGCEKLTSLNLSNFDTSKVMNMSNMFAGCNKLTSLKFGDNFDTSNVIDMSYMFLGTVLTSLDLSNFDTSNVTNMKGIFNASSLGVKSVKLSQSTFNKMNELASNNGCSFYTYIQTSESCFDFETN